MDSLLELFSNTNIPILSAFLLGIITAISPCPLATNITATAFISRDIENKNRVFSQGLFYTLGRIVSYTSLGLIIYFGSSKFEISTFFNTYGERILGPILLIIGLMMMDFISFKLPALSGLTSRFEKKNKISYWGAFLLGIIFALAFCPISASFYFAMLIPMTIATPKGLYLPIVYAIATALPVIIIAYLLAFTVSGIGSFYKKIKAFELWFRRIVSIVFMIIGIYFIYIFYF
jgi:cytochrome c biogenesis protein CcdA